MAKTGQKSTKVENQAILNVSANVEDLVVELEGHLRGAIGSVFFNADKMAKILNKFHEMEKDTSRLYEENGQVMKELENAEANLDTAKIALLAKDDVIKILNDRLNPPTYTVIPGVGVQENLDA